MLDNYITEHESCIMYLNSATAIILTSLFGILGLIIWVYFDERRMRKEEEEELAKTEPEPLDTEEIPRKYLHFQKLCLKLRSDSITDDEYEYITDELLQWMYTNNHPNFDDIFGIIKELKINEIEDANSVAWINTAFLVWSMNPRWIMPYIKHTLPRTRSWTVA